MTPAARIEAAAGILDRIIAGESAEAVLIRWARRARYAGSGDRAALRDLVYTALRRRGRHALLAGYSGGMDPALTGRALMLGMLIEAGSDPASVFTGQRHGPAPLTTAEQARISRGRAGSPLDDLPAWLHADLSDALADDLPAYAEAMAHRAPLWLRVNALRADPVQALAALEKDGIEARLSPDCATALEVVTGARRVASSVAYRSGLVEIQDLSPQMAVAMLGDLHGARVLDFCAGGGGKALALAAQGADRIIAHDAIAARMTDLPVRAARAGARIDITVVPPDGHFDLVVADVPCSGSGTWARDPDARWRLTRADLDRLLALQAQILDSALTCLGPGGRMAYMTCSVLQAENEAQIQAFARRAPLKVLKTRRFGPPDPGDGFFLAVLGMQQAQD